MDLQVSLSGRGDLAARIYRQLLDAILDGRLRPGERLPPTRELARQLEVSRNTVATAYERLTAEGFLVGKVGAGTFVGTVTPQRSRTAPAGGVQPREAWRGVTPVMANRSDTPRYDFRVGTPDPELFPLETWRRLVLRELRPSAVRRAVYADPAGHPDLRSAIARYIGVSRSVRTGADDVLVTSGAQQALDLIGRVLVGPGDCVVVEEPGYPSARAVFTALGARVVGVPVDSSGLDVSQLPPSAALVYVTPSHQFPLGTPMSLSRRSALLDWASRSGAVIVEDDYDSEYRFSDRPLEPLQSIDTGGRVVYVGSFSKTLLPRLRLGFLVAPASLRPALRAAKQLTDWHTELTNQAALARLIDEGLLARHIRRAARAYATRRSLILSGLEDFSEWLEVVPSAAGLHITARVKPGTDLDTVFARTEASGVAVEPLSRYCSADPQPGLVLGYGLIQPDAIPPALALLSDAFHSTTRFP